MESQSYKIPLFQLSPYVISHGAFLHTHYSLPKRRYMLKRKGHYVCLCPFFFLLYSYHYGSKHMNISDINLWTVLLWCHIGN